MHAPPTQFLQRLPAACAPLTVQQVAFHLRGAHRAPRQRARRQHRMRAPAPPALDPQNLDRPPVQVLLVAAVMPKPPAAARRTAHAVQPFGNVFDPVALLLAVDYDDRSGLRGNRVGSQPTVPGFPSSLCSGSPTAKRESQPFSTTRPRALTPAYDLVHCWWFDLVPVQMKVRLAFGNGKSCGRVFGNPLPHGFHEIEQVIGRLSKDKYIVRKPDDGSGAFRVEVVRSRVIHPCVKRAG